ncbi:MULTISPECIES: PIG-L deacetylase family protein [Legionella]|uniref:Glucosamine-6-phosphate deaminase-like protein n=1 Tax=Legionella drozanskii LLAP-1 TaxID=1212489 RepID=A0A0W0SQN8_9GAMM|nr:MULTISPECIES: PIG-L family deacetylase [Legionella]KTC85533.1 glucosamine-6-phosphate deaminase-like protein [Legionella drozanskii LLAP-1]PJE15610.1 MAG: PIG-L family deacetylase [Legionella sp.]
MTPIIAEKKWLNYLKRLPFLIPKTNFKAIILSPHPDDETLGAGGLIVDLIRRNIDVKIIAITDGENAYKNIKDLREIRKKEQENALKKLGVSKNKIIRLMLEDSSVHLAENKLEHLILPFIDKNITLIAPWIGDFHPDHEAVGRVAVKIASNLKINLIFYFFWTWHHSTISEIRHLPLSIYPLGANTLNLKQRAITCYRSQQVLPESESILTNELLKPAQRQFEVFLNYKT